jgi:hypothetical protein
MMVLSAFMAGIMIFLLVLFMKFCTRRLKGKMRVRYENIVATLKWNGMIDALKLAHFKLFSDIGVQLLLLISGSKFLQWRDLGASLAFLLCIVATILWMGWSVWVNYDQLSAPKVYQ